MHAGTRHTSRVPRHGVACGHPRDRCTRKRVVLGPLGWRQVNTEQEKPGRGAAGEQKVHKVNKEGVADWEGFFVLFCFLSRGFSV